MGSWEHLGDKIPIGADTIWTPDIVILNEVGGQLKFGMDKAPLVLADDSFLERTGVNVLWSRRLVVKSRCDVDMRDFPFDQQRCSIIIGPWASSQRQMFLVPQDLQRGFYLHESVHTEEFEVRNISVVGHYADCRNYVDDKC